MRSAAGNAPHSGCYRPLLLTVNVREILDPDLDSDGQLRFLCRGRVTRREDTVWVTLFRIIENDTLTRRITHVLMQVS